MDDKALPSTSSRVVIKANTQVNTCLVCLFVRLFTALRVAGGDVFRLLKGVTYLLPPNITYLYLILLITIHYYPLYIHTTPVYTLLYVLTRTCVNISLLHVLTRTCISLLHALTRTYTYLHVRVSISLCLRW